MTRQEILDTYDVNEYGVIENPGKFEQEMLYVPYFSDDCDEELSFMEDGCGEYAGLCRISDKDRIEFPELGTAAYILIIEDVRGFVSGELVDDETEANKIRAEYERAEE